MCNSTFIGLLPERNADVIEHKGEYHDSPVDKQGEPIPSAHPADSFHTFMRNDDIFCAALTDYKDISWVGRVCNFTPLIKTINQLVDMNRSYRVPILLI